MLQLTTEHFNRIVEQGRAGKPLEICGLMAGTKETDGGPGEVTRVAAVYPMESQDKSALTYSMNPLHYLRVEKQVQAQGLQIIGIYHTHPATQPYPSPTDVAQAHWGDLDDLRFPGYSYLIVSLRDPEHPEPRSFKIMGRRIPEDIIEEPVVIQD